MNSSITTPARCFTTPSFELRGTLLRNMVVPVCALLISLILAPLVKAGAPDGVYQFSSGSGQIEFGGQSFDLSKALIKEAGSVKSGSVTIKNGKITLNQSAASNILSAVVGVEFDVTAKGPSSITFSKSGNSYLAKSSKPVVATLSADVSGSELAAVLRSGFDAKVTGRKLVINVKLGGTIGYLGSVDQQKITGAATIICNR